MHLAIGKRAALGLLLLATMALTVSVPSTLSARTEEAEKFNQSADGLLRKGDLRGAAIQLRNAIQKDPEDGLLRLKLAQVNLRLGDPLAAEASAIAAKERGAPEEQVAPVLAEALYAEGEYGRLLKSVQPGNRDPKIESAVRTMNGLAHLALGEQGEAEPMLRDAVRLDPASTSAKLALVNWLLATSKLDEADQLANEALAAAPESPQALTALGRILVARGDATSAMAKFSAALDRDPAFQSARLSRIGLRIQNGDLDGAQRDLDTVSKVSANAVATIYFQALIQATRGDLKTADATLAKLGVRLGEPPETYYLAGVIKSRLGQTGQAEEYLNRYIARNPKSASAYVTLASISLQRNDAKKAVDQLERALKVSPGNVQALTLLSQAYRAQGNAAKALEVIEAAAQAQPEAATLQTQLALGHVSEGHTTEGIETLERILHASDKGLEVGPTLVLTALRVGEFQKALAAAELLFKREPGNVVYQQLLGAARAANQDLPGTAEVFRRLVDEHPELLSARRNLAGVYVALGRGDDARQLFDQPLKQNPNDTVALTMLAEIDARLGKTPEAIDLLKRANAAAQDSGPGLRLIALLQTQKDLKSALDAVIDLQRRFPQDAAVVDAKARTQIATGDVAGGLQTYREGTEAMPQAALLDRYARALIANKDFRTANDVLRRELALTPGNGTVQSLIVQVEYARSGQDAALAAARSFGSPDSSTGDLLAAQVLASNGKINEAVKLLVAAGAAKPSPTVVNALAGLYERAGQMDQAIAVAKAWLASHPDDIAVRLTLARVYLNAHDDSHARAEYEALASARESDPMVLNNLAWLYQRAGDPRAKEIAVRAYKVAPAPQVADTLGWILTSEGGADAGLKYLQDASKAMPDNLDVQYHLAFALQKTGKADAAREILRAVMAKQVDFDSKADAIKLLSQLGG